MRRTPRNLTITCNHAGLTHFGGVCFFHEFVRVLQLRDFLARHLTYPRRNHRYSVSQMLLALVYPVVLGLDRLETASFLRSNGTFQYLVGLPNFPDSQTLRRFLLSAPESFWEQLHSVNDRLLQNFIHVPDHRSRLIFDLDSTVVTVFGNQEEAAVGYNPRYRGKRSYNPSLCIASNSSYLWDTELRPGNAGTWEGSVELLDTCFANIPGYPRTARTGGRRVRFQSGLRRTRDAASTIRGGGPPDPGFPAPAAGSTLRSCQPELGDDRLRASSPWLAAGPSFRGGATIHSRRGSRNDAVHPGALCLSRLGHQHGPDARRHLALL